MQNIKKIRIGKTIEFRFEVTTNGEKRTLEGRDIKLVLKYPSGVSKNVQFDITDGNHISYIFEGCEQHLVGVYWIEVYENKGKANQSVIDFDCVQLVSRTNQESK